MGGGLRVVPSLRIVIRGPPRVNPPRGLRLSRRVCPAGCRRRPVRVPVPRSPRAGALPRCAGAARRLSGRRPPVQALPAGPGQSPRSRELQRLAARREPGEWDPPWSIPGAAGRCPVHGPAADAHALETARMAWISPAPMTASLRRSRRGCGPDGDRGPFRTRARRRRCGRPGREPSIPPPGKTATGVLPSPTPPERTWRPGPKAEVNRGNTG